MAHEDQPIEWNLFEWDTWDQLEVSVFSFTGITLKTDIGPRQVREGGGMSFVSSTLKMEYLYTKGKTFAHCVMNLNSSTITFYDTDDDEVGHTFALSMTIGESVQPTKRSASTR